MLLIDNKSSNIKVSVVVPAYNEELVISQTLEDLLAQDYSEPVELILSDNNSTDRTVEIAKKYGARIVYESRKGTRFNYDRGFREAKGQILMLTNADVRYPSNWISSLVKAYDDPEVMAAGTDVRFYDAPAWINRFLGFTKLLSPKKSLWGVSLSCRREAFYKVGGFDHGVNTNEDAVFALLVEKIGKVKIVDNVQVLMNGRRFNNGTWAAIKEWVFGIGLNSLYIQVNLALTGKIKTLYSNFGDFRSNIFGQGEQIQISVIIPAGNDQDHIAGILTSLQQQNFQKRFKVYLLDNFSVDLTLQIAKVFPDVSIVTYPGVYDFGNRLRKLIAEVESPVIAFTTPTAKVSENWLDCIFREFNKKRKKPLQVVTGPYVYAGGKLLSQLTNQPFDRISDKFDFHNFAIEHDTAAKLFTVNGNLEQVQGKIEAEIMKQSLSISYAPKLQATYTDSTILESILSNSTSSFRHTFRRLVKPFMGNERQ